MIPVKTVIGVVFFLILSLTAIAKEKAPKFYAYYTHISSSSPFENFSRTGEYADIVVQLPTGKITFWRGTSYLPQWSNKKGKWTFAELIKRNGDGDDLMPDRANAFSHIAIIKNTKDSILIHWRYLPEFKLTTYPYAHTGFASDKFVDEYFYIKPTGHIRRVVIKGTPKIDAYYSSSNIQTQHIWLKPAGIVSDKPIIRRLPAIASNISKEIKRKFVAQPNIYLGFNEGNGFEANADGLPEPLSINGHKPLWKKGIYGSSLQFDGYTSQLRTGPFKTKITENLTVSASLAIGAYPWNWVPIVQTGTKNGFFLGLDAYGHPGVSLLSNGKSQHLKSASHLERNKWYKVTATFSSEEQLLRIFINGKKTDSLNVRQSHIQYGSDGIQIGKSDEQEMPIDAVRPARTYKSSFGFDGLIDELEIYNQQLLPGQISDNFQNLFTKNNQTNLSDMQPRHFPIVERQNKFRAYYTRLKYYETWDNLWRFGPYADVVVEFKDSPCKFVFWRGTSYVPQMVNDKNQWFNNEFNETWDRSGGEGCMEPMSDKENYTSHARIVEQSEARVVINWRVALMDVENHIYANFNPTSGWGDWMDWYYYIYPDGFAVKKMRLYTNGELNHEWQESIVLMGENQKPEEVLERTPVFTNIDTAGKETAYNWEKTPPKKVDFRSTVIHRTNLKSDWDVYTIQRFTGGDVYSSELTPYSVFCTWNHWPTSQIASDGRYASFPDRAAHSSTTHLHWDFYKKEPTNDKPFVEKLLMEGMSNQPTSVLYQLSCSWLNPAQITPVSGIKTASYDPSQRAYLIQVYKMDSKFALNGRKENPIVNPAFVINNWDAEHSCNLWMDGKKLSPGKDYQQGLIYNTNGKRSLVIWVKTKLEKKTIFEINDSGHEN